MCSNVYSTAPVLSIVHPGRTRNAARSHTHTHTHTPHTHIHTYVHTPHTHTYTPHTHTHTHTHHTLHSLQNQQCSVEVSNHFQTGVNDTVYHHVNDTVLENAIKIQL